MAGSEKQSSFSWWRGFLTLPVLRDLLLVLLLVILCWKIATAELVFDFAKFGFVELLATLLAFFAIGLSVAFYLKASETSNTFYDNVYHFTKDTSEILGRIEAGFGERLRHLDEGYSGLRERFDRIPFDVTEAKQAAEREEEQLKRQEAERFKLIDDLAKRARLAEDEKERLFDELRSRDEELTRARREHARLEHQIEQAEAADVTDADPAFYLEKHLPLLFDSHHSTASDSMLRKAWARRSHSTDPYALSIMLKYGLMDANGDLTSAGIDFLRRSIRLANDYPSNRRLNKIEESRPEHRSRGS